MKETSNLEIKLLLIALRCQFITKKQLKFKISACQQGTSEIIISKMDVNENIPMQDKNFNDEISIKQSKKQLNSENSTNKKMYCLNLITIFVL